MTRYDWKRSSPPKHLAPSARNAVDDSADATDIEGLKDVADQSARSLGGLDILPTMPGVEQLGTYKEMTVVILENAFRFNVRCPSTWAGMRLATMLAVVVERS